MTQKTSYRSTRCCATAAAAELSRGDRHHRTRVGAKLLVRRGAPTLGTLGDPDLDRVVGRDALGELEAGLTSTRHYGAHGEAREDTVSVFIESFAPPPRMVIFGAVDFTAALANVAKVLGYRVVVCDARAVFATAPAVPDGRRGRERVARTGTSRRSVTSSGHVTRCACSPTTASSTCPPSSAPSPPGWGTSGAMGSRKTHGKRAERLREAGVDRRAARPHPRADRTRHRCPHPGGDRGVHLRRDHRLAHRPSGDRAARRHRADPLVNYGIEGRRAAVAAGSSGLGLATAAGPGRRRRRRRHLQPHA